MTPVLKRLCCLAILCAPVLRLNAASGVWANNTGDADSNWSSSTNWVSGNVPGNTTITVANTDTATFSAAATVENPTLDASRRMASISIDNSNADYSIGSIGATTLALQLSGTALSITGGGTTNIAPKINIATATQTWNTGSTALTIGGMEFAASRTLTLTNTASVVVASGSTVGATTGSATLTFAGSGSMTINGVVQNSGGITSLEGAAGFTGTVSLNGTNTFSTSMIWRAGTLQLGSSDAMGTGTANLQIGTTTTGVAEARVVTTGAYTITRNITVSNSTSNANHTIGGTNDSGTSTYTGSMTLNNHPGGMRLTAASGGTVDFTGNITGTNTTNDRITKIGDGVVRISGAANTYAGGTTVSAGSLLVNNASGSGTGTGGVAVNAGGTLGGTGTITPGGSSGVSVASTGFMAPGDGIGNLTINLGSTTGTVQMLSGSGFKFQLGTANNLISSIADGSSDRVVINGASAADFAFNSNAVDFLGTGAAGFYKLFDTSSDNASTWTNLVFDGTTGVVSSGLTATNLAPNLSGTFIVGTASNGAAQLGDIYLQVVPEPSVTVLAACAGALALSRSRRRTCSRTK